MFLPNKGILSPSLQFKHSLLIPSLSSPSLQFEHSLSFTFLCILLEWNTKIVIKDPSIVTMFFDWKSLAPAAYFLQCWILILHCYNFNSKALSVRYLSTFFFFWCTKIPVLNEIQRCWVFIYHLLELKFKSVNPTVYFPFSFFHTKNKRFFWLMHWKFTQIYFPNSIHIKKSSI